MRLQFSTWPEVASRLDRSTGIVIPLGSTEQHGPGGLIGTDALVAEGIAARAASEDDDILVAPTLAYAPAQFNLGFAGTVSVRAATFARVIEDVVDSLSAGGFTAFYFLNGHGANIAPVRCACHDLHQRRVLANPATPPLRFRFKSWWEFPDTDALRRRLYGAGEGMHATPSEISITRALTVEVEKLSSYRRRAICMAPVRHVVIDYNGKGMMCCQTRSDAPAHRQAIVGDLAEPGYGLFHLYRDLGATRGALLSPGEKTGVCLTCDVRDNGPDRLARRKWVAGVVRRMPGVARNVDGLWNRVMRRDLAS